MYNVTNYKKINRKRNHQLHFNLVIFFKKFSFGTKQYVSITEIFFCPTVDERIAKVRH